MLKSLLHNSRLPDFLSVWLWCSLRPALVRVSREKKSLETCASSCNPKHLSLSIWIWFNASILPHILSRWTLCFFKNVWDTTVCSKTCKFNFHWFNVLFLVKWPCLKTWKRWPLPSSTTKSPPIGARSASYQWNHSLPGSKTSSKESNS